MAQIVYSVVATGGVIVFRFPDLAAGSFTFSRSADGGNTWQELYSGETYQNDLGEVVTPRFVDYGDGTAAPLSQNTSYLYQITDSSGTTTSPPITPASRLAIESDLVTSILIRTLQAGIDGLTRPSNVNLPRILHAMPLNGEPRLPIITVNMDYGPASQEFPIGVGINASMTNTDVRTVQAERKYSITVLCLTVQEREFYRDAIIGILTVAAPEIFGAIWDDTSFRFQAYSSQNVGQQNSPGFYFAQVMVELQGSFNVATINNFGLIEQIDMDTNGDEILDVT